MPACRVGADPPKLCEGIMFTYFSMAGLLFLLIVMNTYYGIRLLRSKPVPYSRPRSLMPYRFSRILTLLGLYFGSWVPLNVLVCQLLNVPDLFHPIREAAVAGLLILGGATFPLLLDISPSSPLVIIPNVFNRQWAVHFKHLTAPMSKQHYQALITILERAKNESISHVTLCSPMLVKKGSRRNSQYLSHVCRRLEVTISHIEPVSAIWHPFAVIDLYCAKQKGHDALQSLDPLQWHKITLVINHHKEAKCVKSLP